MLIVFDDMIAEMEANKKIESNGCLVVHERKKNSTFQLFLYPNLISKCLKIQD